jgi:5'(3')-deoxyribonucleotidase
MRAVKEDSQMSQDKLRDQYPPNVSLSTMDQYQQQKNHRNWLAKKQPNLENKHVFQMLQWALEHKNLTQTEWEGVNWSDEC